MFVLSKLRFTSASPSTTLTRINSSLLVFAIKGVNKVPIAVIRLPNPKTHFPPYLPDNSPAMGCDAA